MSRYQVSLRWPEYGQVLAERSLRLGMDPNQVLRWLVVAAIHQVSDEEMLAARRKYEEGRGI